MKKNILRLMAVFITGTLLLETSILPLASSTVVHAKTLEEIQKEKEEKQKEQENTQKEYEKTQGELEGLQGEQEAVREEIAELDGALVEIMAGIALMEEEIAKTQEEIEVAQADYDAAKAKEEAQYEAMKARMRYLYEKGDHNYLEIFMKAKSFADMLNQASFIEKLYDYDEKMLSAYIAVKEEVGLKKEALEDQKSELEADEYELEQEQGILEELLSEKKAVSADYDAQISKVSQEASAYKAKIKQQNSEIKKLEEEEAAKIKEEEERKKKEEEERKKREEAASGGSSGNGSGSGNSGSSGSSSSAPPVTGSGTGADIAKYACQFVGNPYVPGGTSLTNGADCSGFTQSVYRQFGYNIPRTSYQQRSAGREVTYDQAQAGDLICYAGHVAIYLGNGRIVHASSVRTGIKYGYATYKPILSVRRIVG